MTDYQPSLFNLDQAAPKRIEVETPRHPVWTENKARLIDAYLFLFVQITKHGTYIDGFAGPQDDKHPDLWAARLVLAREPRWLRNIHLFEARPKSIRRLEQLISQQPADANRRIRLWPGDFNANVHQMLASGAVGPKEATFALLDQRTFECSWSSVVALAKHKTAGFKIELFYFLPNGWLNRAIAALKKNKKADMQRWWGRDDWRDWARLSEFHRMEAFQRRFREELGYAFVYSWPILERKHGGRIMYFMIHAADHEEAPKLMSRAYVDTVTALPEVQCAWNWPPCGKPSAE